MKTLQPKERRKSKQRRADLCKKQREAISKYMSLMTRIETTRLELAILERELATTGKWTSMETEHVT